MNCEQLREYIIRPALHEIGLYSEDAEELLIATCAHESKGSVYIAQIKGPALGIYQIEPKTFYNVWEKMKESYGYNGSRGLIYKNIMRGCNFSEDPRSDELITNLKFSTMIARVLYYISSEVLPNKDSIDEIWEFYKKVWNSSLGKATKDEFVADYKKFTGKD
jgi:hypothetical protein